MDYFRTSSFHVVDLNDNTVTELISMDDHDVVEMYATPNYLCLHMVIHRNGVPEEDYRKGQIWRIDRQTSHVEFCYDLSNYLFHAFRAADDEQFVFYSDDNVADASQIVVVDPIQRREACLLVPDDLDYTIGTNVDGAPTYLAS